MTLSLNAAWIAALSSLPAAGIAAALCRRRLVHSLRQRQPSRAQRILLCLTLLVCCIFSLSALMSLAEQTFLSQAQTTFVLLATLFFLLLCAAGKAEGAARAAYALRYLAPLIVVLLALRMQR